MKVFPWIIGFCVLVAWLAFYKAMAPRRETRSTSAMSVQAIAYDAQSRIDMLQYEVASQRWLFLTTAVMSVACSVMAWKAWNFARSHGAQETLESRLCALERGRPVFVPAPTHRSVLAPFEGAVDVHAPVEFSGPPEYSVGRKAPERAPTHEARPARPAPLPPRLPVEPVEVAPYPMDMPLDVVGDGVVA